jgi:hypothetical protein
MTKGQEEADDEAVDKANDEAYGQVVGEADVKALCWAVAASAAPSFPCAPPGGRPTVAHLAYTNSSFTNHSANTIKIMPRELALVSGK